MALGQRVTLGERIRITIRKKVTLGKRVTRKNSNRKTGKESLIEKESQ